MYLKTIKTLAFPNSPKNEFSGSHELKDFRSSPWRFLIRFLNSICFWPEWTRRYLHIPKGRLCVLWWGPAVWRQKLVLFRQQHLIVCSRSKCTVQHSHTKSASCDDYRTMEQRVFPGGYDIPVNLREREREKERRTVPVVCTYSYTTRTRTSGWHTICDDYDETEVERRNQSSLRVGGMVRSCRFVSFGCHQCTHLVSGWTMCVYGSAMKRNFSISLSQPVVWLGGNTDPLSPFQMKLTIERTEARRLYLASTRICIPYIE